MRYIRLAGTVAKSIVANIQARTDPVQYARRLGVQIGNNVRLINIRPGMGTFGAEPYLVCIGDDVTISGAVQFITHDGGVAIFRMKHPGCNIYGGITVGNGSFVGYGAILMPGISIGENCVIGAGSVVTKPVDGGMVAAGDPARVIMTIDEYYQKKLDRFDCAVFSSPGQKRQYLISRYRNPIL